MYRQQDSQTDTIYSLLPPSNKQTNKQTNRERIKQTTEIAYTITYYYSSMDGSLRAHQYTYRYRRSCRCTCTHKLSQHRCARRKLDYCKTLNNRIHTNKLLLTRNNKNCHRIIIFLQRKRRTYLLYILRLNIVVPPPVKELNISTIYDLLQRTCVYFF